MHDIVPFNSQFLMEGFNSFIFLPQILITDTFTLNIVYLIFRRAVLAVFFPLLVSQVWLCAYGVSITDLENWK